MDEADFLCGRDDLERDLEGAVASADDDHPFAFELPTVPHAVLDAVRLELRFPGHPEVLRLEQPHPHREDDRSRLIRVSFEIGKHTSELQSLTNLVCRLL